MLKVIDASGTLAFRTMSIQEIYQTFNRHAVQNRHFSDKPRIKKTLLWMIFLHGDNKRQNKEEHEVALLNLIKNFTSEFCFS
jgi:hypothetical protein